MCAMCVCVCTLLADMSYEIAHSVIILGILNSDIMFYPFPSPPLS